MDVSEQVLAIQRSYPQIFFACHTEHVRRPSTGYRLSESDSNVLQHLDHRHGCRPGELAAHLGLSPSSLSATVGRLERLGYVARLRSGVDRRAAELRLTQLGVQALQGTSVLDTVRLGAVLGRLDTKEREAAVRGLELLARGAHALLAERGSATRWERKRKRRAAR